MLLKRSFLFFSFQIFRQQESQIQRDSAAARRAILQSSTVVRLVSFIFQIDRQIVYFKSLRTLKAELYNYLQHHYKFLETKTTLKYIERFHMTSRRQYLCSKTMKRRPFWCTKTILWELNSFLMQTLSFVPINLHICWPREQ